jgi:hypothetical protein
LEAEKRVFDSIVEIEPHVIQPSKVRGTPSPRGDERSYYVPLMNQLSNEVFTFSPVENRDIAKDVVGQKVEVLDD